MTALYVGLWFFTGIVAATLSVATDKKSLSPEDAWLILLALLGPVFFLLVLAYIIFELPKESK